MMFINRKLLHFLLLLFSFSDLRGQEYVSRSFTVKDGIPMGYISCLYQDKSQFIWAGTYFGLCRFDGQNFRSYTPNLKNCRSLHSNIIHNIKEGSNGLLWLGTENGIVVMDPLSEHFLNLQDLDKNFPGNSISNIILDREDKVWFMGNDRMSRTIYVVHPPDNLTSLVRMNRNTESQIMTDSVVLPGNSKAYPVLFYRKDTRLSFIVDSDGVLYELDMLNKQIRINQPEELAKSSDYRQGIFLFNETDRRGIIFKPGLQTENTFKLDQRSEYLLLPDGRSVFCSFFDKKIRYGISPYQKAENNNTGSSDVFFTLEYEPSMARLVDQNGNLWVGTTGNGITVISQQQKSIRNHLTEMSVFQPTVLPNGLIWAGHLSPCVRELVDIYSGERRSAPWTSLLPDNTIPLSIFHSTGRKLTVLVVYNRSSGKAEVCCYYWGNNSFVKTGISVNCPFEFPPVMTEDTQGNIWLAGFHGEVILFNPASNGYRSFNISYLFPEKFQKKMLSRSITSDHLGRIWIGNDIGIVRVESNGKIGDDINYSFRAFHNYGPAGILFRNNGIFCIYADPGENDVIWLGTLGGGLVRFDTKTLHNVAYTSESGLSNDIVLSIVPDQNRLLWIATGTGISCFDSKNESFTNLFFDGSIYFAENNASSAAKMPDGNIIFGSTKGLFIVDPTQVFKGKVDLKARISYLLFNLRSGTQLWNEGRAYLRSDSIPSYDLDYLENNIIVGVSCPGGLSTGDLIFSYRIKGSKDWITVSNHKEISLSGLPPGKYLLEIVPGNNPELYPPQNYTRLCFIIHPPWYFSNPAYVIYSLIVLIIIRFFFILDREKLMFEHEAEISRQQNKQAETIDALRKRFFAYIAHEFKTPLTIISGMGTRLKQQPEMMGLDDYLHIVDRETDQMLHMINELVDISRLEDNSLVIRYLPGDFNQFIRQISQSFHNLADYRGIGFTLKLPNYPVWIEFDATRIRYIFNNLMNNAFNHTEKGGQISVELLLNSASQLELSIEDSGSGIAEEDLQNIFKKYYRGKNEQTINSEPHFGLGLSFVQEIASRMDGRIVVSSVEGQGSKFTLFLPLRRCEPVVATGITVINTTHDIPVINNNTDRSPLLLIAEDNPDVMELLTGICSPGYRIIKAGNGDEALQLTLEHIPDIILTDVIMPGIDGIELTHRIKTSPITSHIPVVMLSARSEVADRIIGHKAGAEAYLGKPFNGRELELTLQNLYNLRISWQQRYQHVLEGDTTSISNAVIMPEIIPVESITQTDEFMNNVMKVVSENYSDEDFGPDQIARLLHISRAGMYKKLSAISPLGVMEIIKNFRLHKAIQLLEENPELSTKEVAFMVGFKERTHFSSSFQRKFGFSPSEVRKKH